VISSSLVLRRSRASNFQPAPGGRVSWRVSITSKNGQAVVVAGVTASTR
jgi:hypothetical protein